MMGGWVYMVTNRPNGILYIGVTSDLSRRAWEHREGLVEGFTKRYGLKTLVYYEWFDEIVTAIRREKTMKTWPRACKVRAIMERNRGGVTCTMNWRDAGAHPEEKKAVDGRDEPDHDDVGLRRRRPAPSSCT